MSDRRIQELLRAFRRGDRDAGPAVILALGRTDQLEGCVIRWHVPRAGGPSGPREETVHRWNPYHGFRCPECDVFAKLGPVQTRNYERGVLYVFNCHPKVPFPPYGGLQGSLTLGKNRGPLTVGQIVDLVGDHVLEIKTAVEIQEENRVECEETNQENAHDTILRGKGLRVVKLKNAKQRLARWTKKLNAWDEEHEGRPFFPGDRQAREALQEKVDEVEELVAELSPEKPETPPSMSVFRAKLINDHHLASLWVKKSGGGINGVSVDLIMVEEDHRGEGHGQRAMEELCAYADRVGLYLALTPSNVHGASVRRLKKWYRSLGFKKNTGRGADYRFSESMLRTPKEKKNG